MEGVSLRRALSTKTCKETQTATGTLVGAATVWGDWLKEVEVGLFITTTILTIWMMGRTKGPTPHWLRKILLSFQMTNTQERIMGPGPIKE
jgi:hypothetical protein